MNFKIIHNNNGVELEMNGENLGDIKKVDVSEIIETLADKGLVKLEVIFEDDEKSEIEAEQEMIKQAEIENWKQANNID